MGCRCLEEGAEDFIVKPVKLSDVKRLKDYMFGESGIGVVENEERVIQNKRKLQDMSDDDDASSPPSISSFPPSPPPSISSSPSPSPPSSSSPSPSPPPPPPPPYSPALLDSPTRRLKMTNYD